MSHHPKHRPQLQSWADLSPRVPTRVPASVSAAGGPGGSAALLNIQPKKNTMLVSHGRPPWYGEDGNRICDAFVIAVAGGSASGKTHVARQIDSFYKYHTPEELKLAHANLLDFDHPDALDMPLYAHCLAELKACKQTNIPVYSFAEHQRLEETKYLYGATIIIAEGIMALVDPQLRELYDLKVFVQADSDLMLARRIKRDVKERGRNVEGVLDQYLRYVKPSYDNFVRPTAAYADIIVPGSNNAVAIDLISTHIKQQLQERTRQFREKIAVPHLYYNFGSRDGVTTPPLEELGLTVLEQTPQLTGIFTIMRNKETHKQDFVFFADRLATILVERALQHLPYVPHVVTTPVGVQAEGKKSATQMICGVTILRSGGALERGFRRVIRDVPVGSLLVQSESTSGEPMLLHVMLPTCIRNRKLAEDTWVLLMDAQIGTAAAAFMSIRVLLDHGVREDHIIFVTFLVARGGGVSVLRRAFPKVNIVCGAVDDQMREGWMEGYQGEGGAPEGSHVTGRKCWIMQPGMGQIGDRYYL
ncbi:armadillo/beta-catenin/plakoglobin [Cyathus striatus]|nr:armadillo/beta-catenin/plakoglobin [Cyathus striatus]